MNPVVRKQHALDREAAIKEPFVAEPHRAQLTKGLASLLP